MDQLVITKYFDQSEGYDRVHILINGVPLVEILREFERQFDQKLAGAYSDIAAVELDRNALAGDGSGDWIDVLTCTCGIVGCWSFQVKVRADKEMVNWHAFQQPHRVSGSAAGEWSYSTFGAFQFDRVSYSHQLERLA